MDANQILCMQDDAIAELYKNAEPADRMAFQIGMLKHTVFELCQRIKTLETEIIYLEAKNGN